jgi:SAM-dependent methyltransferase
VSPVFSAYAAYYDLIYQDKDYKGEAIFVHDLLLKNGVPQNGDLLELGCGTGRHAEEFARMGHAVLGVDVSARMVEAAIARKPPHLSEALQFLVGDVCDVRTNRHFDAVISLFHVVGYQATNAELNAMFETAAAHLTDRGVFLFDCWFGPAVLTDKPAIRIKRVKTDEIQVLRIAEPEMHPNDNRVDVNYTVQVKSLLNGEVHEFIEKHRIRYLFAPEVEYLLQKNGLKMINCVEWLTGKQTGLDTWFATFVAIKES